MIQLGNYSTWEWFNLGMIQLGNDSTWELQIENTLHGIRVTFRIERMEQQQKHWCSNCDFQNGILFEKCFSFLGL